MHAWQDSFVHDLMESVPVIDMPLAEKPEIGTHGA